MDFYDLDLDDATLDALDAMRFEKCSPIQEAAIPVILEGKDVIGVAQTGTGKTAAYLLPILNQLNKGTYSEDHVNCVIMAPTRELAQQIDKAMEGFSYFMNVSSVAIYGGNDGIRYEQEKRGLTKGADIVIATPGRLISHMSLGNVDFSKVSFFVLDEADRMLDMGFSEDILQIEKMLPKQRLTILFSATMPDKIVSLAKKIMNNPVEIKLAVSKPAEKIDQGAYLCREGEKIAVVKHIFQQIPPERVIVFASSKQKVKELNIALKRRGYNSDAMHSDLEQKQRDETMNNFKANRTSILVATDIVARGIDIDDIQMVINYDVPHDSEDYIHRIGRTARANRTGQAITLVSEKDYPKFCSIEKFLGRKIEVKKNPEGCIQEETFRKQVSEAGGSGERRGRGRHHGPKRREVNGEEKTNANRSRRRGHKRGGGRSNQKNSAPKTAEKAPKKNGEPS